jgi:hypothetical protein
LIAHVYPHNQKKSNMTDTIKIIASPARRFNTQGNPPSSKQARYPVHLPDGTYLGAFKTPLLDSARKLIEMGFDPRDRLEMWWDGQTYWAAGAVLGKAAKLTLTERQEGGFRYRKHVAMPDLQPVGPGMNDNDPDNSEATEVAA